MKKQEIIGLIRSKEYQIEEMKRVCGEIEAQVMAFADNLADSFQLLVGGRLEGQGPFGAVLEEAMNHAHFGLQVLIQPVTRMA